ncbi:interleukin 17-7 [Plakobranchus ocellatus]|uniref:Interleukin 17-7 n=1 Tax=Plakobranchus ocellatus TaxID=259542 RepID=A0AAV4CCP3_9GAST|nr:interleukin 17-7 [Plakobranchus ocellatus]
MVNALSDWLLRVLLLWHLLQVGRSTETGDQPAVTEDICGIPDYHTIKGQLLQHYDIFDSFYKLPRFAEVSSFPRQNISHEAAYLQDNSMCQLLQNQPIGYAGRNPCPGVWELSRDPNRVPCLQREYKCRCLDCLLPPGLAPQNNRPQCQPIYNYVPVMRKLTNLNTGLDQWTYTLEPVVVACTCMPRQSGQAVAARA